MTVGASTAWVVDFAIFGVAGGALLTYSMFLGEILMKIVPAAWALARTVLKMKLTPTYETPTRVASQRNSKRSASTLRKVPGSSARPLQLSVSAAS